MNCERLSGLKGLVVSFDGDGVTIGSPEWMVRFLNKCARTDYKVSDIDSWGAIKKWAQDSGIDELTASLIEQRWYSPWALFQSPIVPGSWHLLRQLAKAGSEVHIVTSREPALAGITYEWYKQKMPWIPKENIHIRDGGDPRTGRDFKGETVAEIGVNVHHEDNPLDIACVLECSSAYVVALPLGSIGLGDVDRNRIIEIRGSDMGEVYNLYCNCDFIEKINNVSHNG